MPRSEPRPQRRYCTVCGGDGWTPSMAEYKRDHGRPADNNECVFCNGTGYVNEAPSNPAKSWP